MFSGRLERDTSRRGTFHLYRNLNAFALIFITFGRDNITEPGEKEIIDNLTETYKKYNPLFSGFTDNHKNTIGVNKQFYEFLSLTASFISGVLTPETK